MFHVAVLMEARNVHEPPEHHPLPEEVCHVSKVRLGVAVVLHVGRGQEAECRPEHNDHRAGEEVACNVEVACAIRRLRHKSCLGGGHAEVVGGHGWRDAPPVFEEECGDPLGEGGAGAAAGARGPHGRQHLGVAVEEGLAVPGLPRACHSAVDEQAAQHTHEKEHSHPHVHARAGAAARHHGRDADREAEELGRPVAEHPHSVETACEALDQRKRVVLLLVKDEGELRGAPHSRHHAHHHHDRLSPLDVPVLAVARCEDEAPGRR
mmetsp:Transcript_5476/g.18538  ORF Transcript_5476/g.18538 Transcript_5476/m.18538 type:complete len:265 (-) Transcript_5476:56-850(-)